jgi:hypothetical protein
MADLPIPAKIEKLDLRDVLALVRKNEKWSSAEVKYAHVWYKRHLAMCAKYKAMPGIEKQADVVWHYHMLNPVRYAKDCKAVFGRLLDHKPDRKALPVAKKRYEKEYPNYTYVLEGPGAFGPIPLTDCWAALARQVLGTIPMKPPGS